MRLTSALVRLYAALLLVAGVALLFAPEVVFVGMAEGEGQDLVLAQLLGAALLGFAAANWTARGAVLGGIYGRAVVVGNQAFAFIGVLVLLRNLPAERGLTFWFFLLVLAFGAVLYSVLLYRSPRIKASPPEPPEEPG